MRPEYILYALLGLLCFLVLIILIRAFSFKPRKTSNMASDEIKIDSDKAFSDLRKMVMCKTVSHHDKKLDDENEFLMFKQLLPGIFPNIFNKCEYQELGDRALLFKYKGKSSDAPTVLMSHYDVVSCEEEKWEKSPFGGIIENDILWGRGTLDTKSTLNASMQALEVLIAEGFIPDNDIYLAFAGDEEVNGTGASMIVDLFEKNDIKPGLVLDEGGAVVDNVFPGVKRSSALVGIAEKGMLNVEFSYSGNGGHSSSPKPHTPVGVLSKACVDIENHPFKFRITPATSKLFDTMARNSTFVYKIIFANLWLFSPILDLICKKSGGELNALLRTTCAFTQMEGSQGVNVIPPSAKMVANLRLLEGDTTDGAINYLKKVINNDNIKVTKIYGSEPSAVSKTDCDAYRKVESAINQTWSDAIVSPYLMFACSDSRHWGRISDRVYRFSAMAMSSEDRGSIHGNNEKISKNTVENAVKFYVRLLGHS